MYKVYTIGRKGGICSLVPREKGATHLCLTREEGATRLCRQRGEKEFGKGEEERKGASLCVDREVRRKVEGKRMTWKPREFCLQSFGDLLVPGVPTL